jgi:hypothetical protein
MQNINLSIANKSHSRFGIRRALIFTELNKFIHKIRRFLSSVLPHKSSRERRIILIGIVATLGLIVGLTFFFTKKVEAGWWDDTWHYRKSISIGSGSTAGTDFQIKINDYDTSSDISAGKMQTDCSDIRFTSAAGVELPYWIESGCNTSTTDIWVKVDQIPATGGTTIYMYYGNPGASTGSDGKDTFILFDDFEDGDLADWQQSNPAYGAWTVVSNVKYSGNYAAYGTDTSTLSSNQLYRDISLGSFVLEENVRFGETNLYHYPFIATVTPSGSAYWGIASNNGYWQYTIGGAYTNYTTAKTYAATTWYKEVIKYDETAVVHKVSIDGTSFNNVAAKNTSGVDVTGVTRINLVPGISYESGGDMWVDNIFIRQYMSTEPTVGAPGGEEQGTSPIAYWNFDEGYGTTIHNLMEQNGEKDLTGWYKMDEGTGASFADETGVQAGTRNTATWVSGRTGSGLYTDGASTYAYITDNDTTNDFAYNQDFTVSFWVKDGGGNANSDAIVEKWSSLGGGYPYAFRYNTGNSVSFARYDGSHNPSVIGTTTINDGNWHYVVGTKVANTLTLYIDGSSTGPPATDTTTGTTTNVSAIYLGERGGGTQLYNGSFDNIKIFKRGLSAREVENEYITLEGHAINGPTWTDGAQTNTNEKPMGKSLNFDGSDDFALVADSSIWKPESLTVSMWIKPEAWVDAETSNASHWIYPSGDGFGIVTGASVWQWWINTSGGRQYRSIDHNNALNIWHHVVLTYDKTSGDMKFYLDGILKDTQNLGAGTAISYGSGQLTIGGANADYTGNGSIDEIKIYNQALTADQVKVQYNRGMANAVNVGAQESPGNPPVGYWKFDEAGGYVAYDSSGNNLKGTLTNMDPSNDWVQGKVGKALDFDGNDDYVNIGDTSLVDFGAGNFSLSAWVRRDTTGGQDIIIGKDNSTAGTRQLNLLITSTNKARVIYFISTDSPVYLDSTSSIIDNSWHYIVGQRNGNSFEIYIDGVLDASGTTSGSHGTMQSTSAYLQIGRRQYSGSTDEFDGAIDGVRIYNYARTAAQIHQDMGGSPIVYYNFDEGQGTTLHNLQESNGEKGLTGWYKMDEGTGSTFADETGVVNGTVNTATWVSGRTGYGLYTDGGSTYAYIADNDNTNDFAYNQDFTVSFWVKDGGGNATNDALIHKYWGVTGNWSYAFSYDSNSVKFSRSETTHNPNIGGTKLINDGSWHHIVGTKVGSTLALYIDGTSQGTTSDTTTGTTTNGGNINIGTQGGVANYYAGTFDNIKIFKRGWSAAEVAAEYNSLEGHAIHGPVWADGATANANQKPMGKSLNFDDGSSQYVVAANSYTLPTGNNPYSVSVWIKPPSSGTNTYIYSWGSLSANSDNALVYFYNSGSPYVRASNYSNDLDSPAGSITADSWNHVVVTYSGSTRTIYINGKSVATDNPTTLTVVSSNLYIGSTPTPSNYFKDSIDELKIYDYALTADEAQVEYNRGGATVLGVGASSIEPSSSNLAGWWKMDEAGGYVAYDSSGNGNTGTLTSMDPTTDWVQGEYGKALDFDGSDDRVAINSIHPFTSAFTITAWVNFDTINRGVGYDNAILGHGAASVDNGLHIGERSGKPYFGFYGDDLSGTTSLATGTWYYMTFVYDGSHKYIYVNGVLDNSGASGAYANNTANTEIGRYPWGTTSDFDGKIDNVKIFNTNLSAAQIAYEYNQGKPVAEWKFDEKDGMFAYEYAKNIANQNLITNPSFETNTTNWSINGTATITRSPDRGLFGSYSGLMQTTIDTGDNFAYLNITGTASTVYTLSAWVYIPTKSGTTPYNRSVLLYDSTNGIASADTIEDIPDATWTRVSASITTGASTPTIQSRIYAYNSSTSVYYDGVQLEAVAAPGTAYCDGSLQGAGNSWTGTAHASASNCHTALNGALIDGSPGDAWVAGKYNNGIYCDGGPYFDTYGANIQGVQSVSFWVYPFGSSSYGVLSLSTGAYITSSSSVISATGFGTPTYYVNGVEGATAVTPNQWNHVVVEASTPFTSTNIKFCTANGSFYWGDIDEVKIYNYALSADQVKVDMNNGAAVRR